MAEPVLLLHGGAGSIPVEEHDSYQAGCKAAFEVGWASLKSGASALDVVEITVRALEDHPAFDAGTGSVLNSEGNIELDAMIMDGATLSFGSVAAVTRLKNPITLARRVMELTEHNMLAGPGAEDFADQLGLPRCETAALAIEKEIARYQERKAEAAPKPIPGGGTVGAVAQDQYGNIAAATSTGGMFFKLPGRVGDSPIIGAGTYADNLTGGVSATGHGEKIMRVLLSKTATDAIAAGMTAQQAADHAIHILQTRVAGQAGILVIDRQGRTGFAHNTEQMAVAWLGPDDRPVTYIQKQ